jgi:DNA adenine methylase
MRPALRYHGAKWRLAPWVMQFFPHHRCYVEPFGGAAGVLLQKPRSYAEVYNDLDGDVVNFFRVLQNPYARLQLEQLILLTPYARAEFELAWMPTDDPIEKARRLLIRAQMGFGSAGATKGGTGFRCDTMRRCGNTQHLWARFPESIAMTGKRFAGVLIENRPAIEVLHQHDHVQTLHYVDPPYVHSTRSLDAAKRGYFNHEMSNENHEELIKVLIELQGFVVLSGYQSELYLDMLKGWEIYRTRSQVSASRGTVVRTECLWINPACSEQLNTSLFRGVA